LEDHDPDESQRSRLRVEWNEPVVKDIHCDPYLEISGTLYVLSEDAKTRKAVDWPQPLVVVMERESGARPDWTVHHSYRDSVSGEAVVGEDSGKRMPWPQLPPGKFVAWVSLQEVDRPIDEAKQFQVGVCLGKKVGMMIHSTNVAPILPATVTTIAVPGVKRLVAPKSKVEFTEAARSRISERMTRAQVEAVLGCPRGDYTTGPWEYGPHKGIAISGSYSAIDKWRDDTGEIWVAFSSWKNDADEYVVLWTNYQPIVRR
jgi:hypothetical protein